MKRSYIAGFLLSLLSTTALAQPWAGPLTGIVDTNGNQIGSTNPLPVTGTFNSTVTGFTPNGNFSAPLSVSGTSANVALPSGNTVIVSNTGTATAFVTLGTTSGVTATASNIPVPGGSSVSLTVGSNTFLAAITGGGSTTINLAGGAGLFTGFGGGGGSGGSTTPVTQSGVWTVQPGNTPNTTPWLVTGAGGTFPVTGTVAATQSGTWNIGTITGTVAISAASLPLPTGAANATNQATEITDLGIISGAVTSSVMQTNMKQVNGVTTLTGAGVTGTGAQRVGVAQDATTIAGSAPGTAGTASANVVSVQGVSGGVAQPVSGTVAATQSGTWTVTGAGGTFPVTGTVAATQSGTWNVGVSGTVAATQSGTWTVTGAGGTFPITAASLPLPSGAATAAFQEVTVAGTSATSAQGVQGVTGGVAMPVTVPGVQSPSTGNNAVPSSMLLIGGSYNAPLPALTTGESYPLQLTNNGQLQVTLTIGQNGSTPMNFSQGTANVTAGGTYLSTLPTLTNGGLSPFLFNVNGQLYVTDTVAETKLTSLANTVTAAGTGATSVQGVQGVSGGVPVPISGTVAATQSGTWNVGVSGTVAATQSGTWAVTGAGGTFPITAASLPLPSGAALSANQTNGSQMTQIVDGSGNVIGSTAHNLNVECANCSGSGVSTIDEATFTASASLFAGSGGFFQTTPTSNPLTTGQQGMFQVTANRALFVNLRSAAGAEEGTAAAPLSVNCITGCSGGGSGGTSLTDSGTFTQGTTSFTPIGGIYTTSPASLTSGQAGAVQLTVDRQMYVNIGKVNAVTVLTGAGAVGTGSQRVAIGTDSSTIAGSAPGVAGTPSTNVVSVQGVSGGVALPISGTVSATVSGTVAATQSGTWTVTGAGGTFPVTGTVAATQSGTWTIAGISGTISLPTGAATSANQSTEITSLGTIAGAISSSVMQGNVKQVNGITVLTGAGATGTGAQRVGVAQDTSTIAGSAPGTAGTASANVISVQGVSGGVTLPVSGSVSATVSGTVAATQSGTWTVTGAGGTFPVTGTVAATQSGTWNIGSISGTVAISAASLPLPSGAATSANQEVTVAGTSATSAQGVQGVSGGVPMPVSGTVAISGTVPVSGTVAATQSGTWTVTGAGGTFPVTGTVAATQSGTWNVGVSGTVAATQSGTWTNTVTQATASNLNASVGGLAASGSTVSGNPVIQGGRAQSSEATAVTNGTAVATATDLVGKQITMPFANKENFVSGSATITTATNTSLISAVSGFKIYLTGFSCSNTGATTSLITFTSGSGGATLWSTIAPAGGGTNFSITPPVATTASAAVFVTTGSASTSIVCSATGYSGT